MAVLRQKAGLLFYFKLISQFLLRVLGARLEAQLEHHESESLFVRIAKLLT